MTIEDEQLLIKDLCARLPYGVKINIHDDYSGTMKDEKLNIFHLNSTYNIEYRKLRPYLRPISSMTAEEKEEYTSYCFEQPFLQKDKVVNLGSVPMCIDWLNTHHFDYRGLIPMGLALEANEGMYPKM